MKYRFFLIPLTFFLLNTSSCSTESKTPEVVKSTTTAETIPLVRPKHIRGIHITSWYAGLPGKQKYFDKIFRETEINTAVIDIKEYAGEVYVPAGSAIEQRTYVPAISDFPKYLSHLKKNKIYPIARLVVFKDNLLANRKPEWAVKTPEGKIWKDTRGNSWVDPYNIDVWKYNIEIAKEAANIGFAEIQFDYVRFPSDGNVRLCRYSQVHNSSAAAVALENFLEYASQELKPLGVDISIDIFGLTTSVSHDMGIGQLLEKLVAKVDYISPMLYPSHYAPGEYGLPLPENRPYETVYNSLKYARKKMSAEQWKKMRPYLQDFSLKIPYWTKEVQEQIRACYEWNVFDWLLWNPRCAYTIEAIRDTRKLLPGHHQQMTMPATNHYSIEKNCCDTTVP